MAYGTIGGIGTHVTNTVGAGKTFISIVSGWQATISGKLYRASVYMESSTACKFKVFRDDGTNYLFIGEHSFTSNAGLIENVATNIKLKAGDLIGLYITSSNLNINAGEANATMVKTGDITTDSLKSSWSDWGYRIYKLYGDIVSVPNSFMIFI